MGLDCSHNCWHGPYSAFMRWRKAIAATIGVDDLMAMRGYGGTKPWPRNEPLVILLNHSDCDGEIASQDCTPLANRLEQILPLLPDEIAFAGVDTYRDRTEQFIAGLRLAASRGEDVEFM